MENMDSIIFNNHIAKKQVQQVQYQSQQHAAIPPEFCPGLNHNNCNCIKKIEKSITIDRRKASIEFNEFVIDLCKAKAALSMGKLSQENGAELLDKMIFGLTKINDYIIKYDDIRFH